jgi:hypothetical protein
MERLALDVDPFVHDPGRWGVSLVNNADLIVPCLEAAGVRSVVEVGAFAGDLTRLLVEWGTTAGARVGAIDPAPQEGLEDLAAAHEELELIRATSHEALKTIPLPDAIVIDGDHNYFTVSEELRLIGERAQGGRFPLLLFHDVCWPHARRDDYYDPDAVPAEHRQPIARDSGLFPGEAGVRRGGLPYRNPAAREGGPRNGVLTAVEDFVAGREGLRLVVVPAFFGLGVVWDAGAPWADDVAALLAPFDRNPLMERLEANRVQHLVALHEQIVRNNDLLEQKARQETLLRKLLESGTFSVGQLLSRLRQRGEPAYSKDEIRSLLGE